MGHPAPIAAVLRQLRTVRRRSNLRLAQHAAAVWVAVSATAAAAVVLSALRAGQMAFLLVTLLAVAAVLAASAALWRRVSRGWLAAGEVPAHVDTARALRGRVASVTELDGRAHGGLFELLVRQNLDALPRWRAEDLVPEVVPGRPFAAAVAGLSALALVVVLAPTLRPPPPRIVVGDGRMDFVPGQQASDAAERLLVAPGTEHPPSERDGAAAPEPADEPGVAGGLAGASTALQDWLRHALGADERWEAGEELPDSQRQDPGRRAARERRADARPVGGGGDAAGAGAEGADGDASRAARGDQASENVPGGGGGGGAGSDTDPALYGALHDAPGAGGDRFELAIAARVRTRRGAAMDPWSTPPGAEGDRRPALAGRQRAEQPGHRMPVPASFAPLVRRLYAHAAAGAMP